MNQFETWAEQIRRRPTVRNSLLWEPIRAVYLFVLRITTLNRGLSRTLYPDMRMRVSYASRQTMASDFRDTARWDVPCLDLIRRWTAGNAEACFFDVGANHGQFALVVSRWLRPDGKGVYAFEPHPQNRAVLEENLRRNACGNVTVVGAALGDRCGSMTLHGESVTASLVPTTSGAQQSAGVVLVETRDSFCNRENRVPDVIKIDVEGFELEVLKGAVETLTRNGDRIKVICEMHTFMWSDPDFDLALIEFVNSCGLRIFSLDGAPVERIRDYGHYVLAQEFS